MYDIGIGPLNRSHRFFPIASFISVSLSVLNTTTVLRYLTRKAYYMHFSCQITSSDQQPSR